MGERVDHVQLGSFADQLRLRPGDTIVAINGTSLADAKSWDLAIDRISKLGGWITLKIQAGDTGTIAYRTANLGSLIEE